MDANMLGIMLALMSVKGSGEVHNGTSYRHRLVDHNITDNSDEYIEYNMNSNRTDSRDIGCSKQEDILVASSEVNVLTHTSSDSDAGFQKTSRWTIIPKHAGGSVTVVKRDNIVLQDIFEGGCSTLHVFESSFNKTRGSWCQESRLLACHPISQIQYHFYGYSPISQPGKAINIEYTPSQIRYDDTSDESFSMYYYECGGERSKGLLRSPRFPSDFDPTPFTVYCKWDLTLKQDFPYGLLTFTGFKLPHCETQRLTILRDTLLHESEVADGILDILNRETNASTDTSMILSGMYSTSIPIRTDYVIRNVKDSRNSTSSHIMEIYREYTLTSDEIAKNPRLGIHIVERRVFCGGTRPSKRWKWRKGRTNITLILQSRYSTLREEGFSARISLFSRRTLLRSIHQRQGNHLHRSSKSLGMVPRTISNYIILIALVPTCFTLVLCLMICQLRRRVSSIANNREGGYTERTSVNTRTSTAGRLVASQSSSRLSSFRKQQQQVDRICRTSKKDPAKSNRIGKRKGSLINMKPWINRRKSSLRLKTVFEEGSSILSKHEDMICEEGKITEPTEVGT